jgi:hypothetical protein
MNRFFLILILFAAGCTSPTENSSDTTETNSRNEKINAASFEGCYQSVFNKDTSRLRIVADDNRIIGELSYKRFEKDSNNGTINGEIKDSLIIAYYTFQSEGVISVREVVFKPSDNGLLEGFGDIEISQTGDTAKFKDISQLQFQDNLSFIKENCK